MDATVALIVRVIAAFAGWAHVFPGVRYARYMPGGIPVVLSKDHDGYVMGEILRSSSLLLTSRYHAQVLASGASVPAVAVSMDERLDNLSAELGTPRELLLHVDQSDLAERVLLALDYAQDNRDMVERCLADARSRLVGSLGEMADEFALYVSARSGRQRDYSGMAK